MGDQNEITTLEGLLERIEKENHGKERVTVRAVIESSGARSFGPLLLVPGLIAFSPLSGIPGVPTLVGTMVFLICGQLLIGRKHFWLPEFILRRSIAQRRFDQTMKMLRKPARVIDRLLKPRLTFLVEGLATYLIAAFSLLMAIGAPFMELLPFAISGVGAVLTFLSFGLLARDGVVVLAALALFAGMVVIAAVVAG